MPINIDDLKKYKTPSIDGWHMDEWKPDYFDRYCESIKLLKRVENIDSDDNLKTDIINFLSQDYNKI